MRRNPLAAAAAVVSSAGGGVVGEEEEDSIAVGATPALGPGPRVGPAATVGWAWVWSGAGLEEQAETLRTGRRWATGLCSAAAAAVAQLPSHI